MRASWARLQAPARVPCPCPSPQEQIKKTLNPHPPPRLPPLQRLPERILEKCVKGMLPKGRIASPLFNHLKVRTRPAGS